MTGRVVAAVVVGAFCGLLAPLPEGPAGETVAGREAGVDPSPAAEPDVPCDLTTSRAALDEARRATDSARADHAAVLAAFDEDWGEPTEAPPGWDPAAREAELTARLDRLPVGFSEVVCDPHPCRVYVGGFGDDEALAAALGRSADEVVGASVFVDGVNHPFASVVLVDELPLSPSQALWVERLRERGHVRAAQAWLETLAE